MPGGHLEVNEHYYEVICREVKEELGAIILPKQLKLVSLVDAIETDKIVQAIHVSFGLLNPNIEHILMGPERCEEWRYFDINSLPLDNFFEPHQQILENYLNNVIYNI